MWLQFPHLTTIIIRILVDNYGALIIIDAALTKKCPADMAVEECSESAAEQQSFSSHIPPLIANNSAPLSPSTD